MTEQSSVNKRIKTISDYFFKGNTSAMARATSIKQATLRDIISEKVKPSYDTIKLIIECSTLEISPEWLIVGKGDIQKTPNASDALKYTGPERELMYRMMLAKETKVSQMAKDDDILNEKIENVNIQTRPRIPLTAAAGSLSNSEAGVTLADCEQLPIIHQFPAYDFTMFIKGDSMSPRYESGDEIACRKIDQARFIQWGKPHVLDTTQGIIIKRVYEDGNSIRCVSCNPNYADFSIPKEDIYSMGLVVGSLNISEM